MGLVVLNGLIWKISEDVRSVIAYYSIVLAIFYIPYLMIRSNPVFWNALSYSPYLVLIVNAIHLISLIIVAYAILRLIYGNHESLMKYLGIKSKGFLDSLIITGALFTIPNLILLIVAIVLGVNVFSIYLENAKRYTVPWFSRIDPSLLPIVAITLWFIVGITCFPLLQAYPYELLSRRPKKMVMPLIATMFIMVYNLPLVTSEFKLDDIIYLGILAPVAYHLTRNSLGVVVNYVMYFEFPVAVAFLKGFGEAGFSVLLIGRITWGIMCLLITISKLLTNYLNRQRENN